VRDVRIYTAHPLVYEGMSIILCLVLYRPLYGPFPLDCLFLKLLYARNSCKTEKR
jgi:hypothetical protein